MASKSKTMDSSASVSASPREEFSTKWDIDSYRTQHESEEHWQLRRLFLEKHKDKFPEDRLVCLAQVFVNMEFLGCKYPVETMALVNDLAKDLAKDFREKRSKRLKRTFVAASDAAEARAKGRGGDVQHQLEGQGCSTSQQAAMKRKSTETSSYATPAKRQTRRDLFENLPYNEFVLYLVGGRGCLRTSALRSNVNYEEKETMGPGNKKKVILLLDGKEVANACEENIKATKAKAFSIAFEMLQKKCYSIKLNPLRDTIKVNKSNNKVICNVTPQQVDTFEEQKLDDTNKGYKMLKIMGWTGGGLGSQTQGRKEPVGYLFKNNRAGLGREQLDRRYFTQMLQNYIDSEDVRELEFEPSFTKDERAVLHELAGKFNLRSSSYGKEEERRLIISKKTTNEQILTEILLNNKGSYRNKYFVQVPESKASLFPEHTATLQLDP